MLIRRLVPLSALAVALAVGAGAFGAHGLESRIDSSALETWETGARYLVYAGLASWLIGLTAARSERSDRLKAPGVLVLLGGLLFFVTLCALALGGPRVLGAITPIGGAAMIGGLLWFLVASWGE